MQRQPQPPLLGAASQYGRRQSWPQYKGPNLLVNPSRLEAPLPPLPPRSPTERKAFDAELTDLFSCPMLQDEENTIHGGDMEFSAGILGADEDCDCVSLRRGIRDRWMEQLARRWAKYRSEKMPQGTKRAATEPAVDEGYMSAEGTVTPRKRQPTSGLAEEILRGSRMPKRPKYSHSWLAPNRDLLPDILEEETNYDCSST